MRKQACCWTSFPLGAWWQFTVPLPTLERCPGPLSLWTAELRRGPATFLPKLLLPWVAIAVCLARVPAELCSPGWDQLIPCWRDLEALIPDLSVTAIGSQLARWACLSHVSTGSIPRAVGSRPLDLSGMRSAGPNQLYN